MSETWLQLLDQSAAVACDNCQFRGVGAELELITDIEERLDPGGIVPAGQCPVCGALAYLSFEDEDEE